MSDIPAPAPVQQPHHMDPNVGGLLSYLVGWLTGLYFYLTTKDPYVRFHASQSIVVFGGITALSIVNNIVFPFRAQVVIGGILNIAALILWILLMVKAYKGERYELPLVQPLVAKLYSHQTTPPQPPVPPTMPPTV